MIEQFEPTETQERMVPVLKDDGSIDERRTAFEVWAMVADRSPTRTARTLREEFAIDLTPDVIRKWAQRYEWTKDASQLYSDTAPTFFERTRSALIAAGPPAANYLRDVVSGNVSPDKNMIVASVAALDRLGFLPHTRREAEQGKTPAHGTGSTESYEALTDEELRQAIAARVTHLRGS